jgi:hypothetical protein
MTRAVSAPRQPGQPLLSLAIPTFNRAPFLAKLLETLLPQFGQVSPDLAELIVSDNCSDDNTPEIVATFQQRGLNIRYIRNEQNIGADGNFLQCLNLATGQYVWVMGDDDLLVQNAINNLLSLLAQDEYDLVYLSSFAFNASDDTDRRILDGTISTTITNDKLGRFAEVVTDGRYFLEKVNALIGLISVMLVNKNRLLATPHPAIETLADSNLMQVGWLFPLVHQRMSVLFVWKRLVGYRSYNSGGWGICEVFGNRLQRIARQYFAQEPRLARGLMNGVLRYWMCDAIIEMRRGRHAEMNQENFAADIRHVFYTNWRYWLFVYPVAELPLPLAEFLYRFLALLNKLTRIGQGLYRHLFRHGRYLQP